MYIPADYLISISFTMDNFFQLSGTKVILWDENADGLKSNKGMLYRLFWKT